MNLMLSDGCLAILSCLQLLLLQFQLFLLLAEHPRLLTDKPFLLDIPFEFGVMMLFMLQLFLQLNYGILQLQPSLFLLSNASLFLLLFLFQLPLQPFDLVLLHQQLFVEICHPVTVQLQLLEVLDLQLQFVQLALYGLLFAEAAITNWRLPEI